MVMRKFLMSLGLGVALLAMTGCNTVSGLGKDIEAVGDAISDAADDAKD